MSKKATKGSSPDLSPAKRRLFTLLMVLFPFLLLLVLEFSLRLLDYGGNLNLVTRRTIAGREFCSLNRSAGRRYFAQPGAIVPELVDDTFEIKKAKNTKRIFCLGESTMAGFPFEFHATPSSFLRDRLKVLLPQYNVEVVNVGLSAIGTYVVQDFMDELLAYEPDLFLIYVGHNEFYGIYGVGSSINIPGSTWLTRLTLTLQKSRVFVLIRDGYVTAQRILSKPDQKPDQSLMGQMVANQYIPLDGDLYKRAKNLYHENLARLIETAQSHHIPIIFSTLVSNWRGQHPFVSMFDANTSSRQQSDWQQFIRDGDSSITRARLEDASSAYANATYIDSLNAMAFYRLGTTLYSLGRYQEAKQVLLRAKDLDALRFRATEEFQSELISMCRQHNVPMARVDSAFIDASPHGILDNTLFLEHLHPNTEGYFLMAKTFCRAIEQSNLLASASDWHHDAEPADSVLLELSRVTEFDRTVGKVKIDLLKRRWPFETGSVNHEFTAANSVESVVFRMLQGGISWSDARYLLAEFYAHNKQFDLARGECLAIAKIIPFHYKPLLVYADYFSQEGKKEEAKAAYSECIKADDNPYARMKYAILLLQEENASASAAQLEAAFNLDQQGKYTLSADAAATARYVLGVSYAKLGKLGSARENLQRALAIHPGYQEATDLLTRLGNH